MKKIFGFIGLAVVGILAYMWYAGKKKAATATATPANKNAITSFWGAQQQAQVTSAQDSVKQATDAVSNIAGNIGSIFAGAKGAVSPSTSGGGSPAPTADAIKKSVVTTSPAPELDDSDFDAFGANPAPYGDGGDEFGDD